MDMKKAVEMANEKAIEKAELEFSRKVEDQLYTISRLSEDLNEAKKVLTEMQYNKPSELSV